MHTDARTLDDDTLIEGDLCIVGAGAAGISMALEWVGTDRDVILLEGGGFEVDPKMQELYKGEIAGQSYFPLDAARLHVFGGTTGHWSGWCAPLDPIDFEKREWVPNSGWPISREDLDPFYVRAHELVELGPHKWDAAYWARQNPDASTLPLRAEAVWTKMWQFSPPTRFGREYREEITGAENVHLYTYANAAEVQVNEPVTAVRGVRVKTPNGKEHRAEASHYVLACGAIQNARLLLASNRKASAGLGNDHDLVGRYFMEHLEMPGAQLALSQPRPMKLYMGEGYPEEAQGELSLTKEVQKRRRLLNGTASLSPGVFEEISGTFQRFDSDFVERIWKQYNQNQEDRHDETPDEDTTEAEDNEDGHPSQQRAFKMRTRQEQAPNPNSRVTLTDETDALGMPRVSLDWRLTNLDKRSIRGFYEAVGEEMGRSGLGRVQLLEWLQEDESSWPDFLSGGWHHMGTTRMHEEPTQGVVDADCKVHGLGNLYLAGSGTFPTSGSANPTLTLIALSLRLSDHLKAQME